MEMVFGMALLVGLGMLGGIELRERPKTPMQTVELRFGTDVTVDSVSALLASVAGLPSNAVVWLDVIAETNGIHHRLHGSQATIDSLRGQWHGVLPSLRLEETANTSDEWSTGAVLRLQGRYPVLRSDAAIESTAALLGSLQPLGREEATMLRWILAPTRRPSLPHQTTQSSKRHDTKIAGLLEGAATPRADHLRALRVKYAGPVIAGVGMVAVKAGHRERAAHLMSRVVSVLRSRRGAYGGVVVRKRSAWLLARLLERPTLQGGGDIYSPAELAPILGLPISAPQIPGLRLGTAPILMASPRIPSTGRALAMSNWPGTSRTLAQPVVGGLSHTLIAGPSGVGKSALICNLIVQDLQAGRGCLLVDGKGDLAEDVQARVPDDRVDDVIVLDPASNLGVPGLRVFGRGDHELAELTADLILGILADIFADSWGPLSARWLRAGLVLLARDPQATLADFPFVFTHDAFRRRLVSRTKDPLARATWAAFEAMGSQERAHQLAAPLNKIEEVIGRRVVRSILAQPNPKLDMNDVLRSGKVVIVSLAPGRIGSPSARLIGALIVHQLFQAVQARAAIPAPQRTPFFAYVDEPKIMGDIPVPLDSLYELARGMGCGILLGAQSLTQLPSALRTAAATNASTLIAFRQSSEDARLLARELPGVQAEGLQNLNAFEVIARIGLGPGDVVSPASGITYPLPPAISDPDAVRRASAARYGADPDTVDAQLAERHRADGPGEQPVGRSRRSS
jgi:hypothetical protein